MLEQNSDTQISIGNKLGIALIVLAGIFMGCVSIWYAIMQTKSLLLIDEYQTVAATIEGTYVTSHTHTAMQHGTSQVTTSWNVVVDMTYTWHDQVYTADNVEIKRGYNSQFEADVAAQNYRVDETIDVWIHPHMPATPLLPQDRPYLSGIITSFTMGAIFFYVFIGIIIEGFKDKQQT